jgi:hypothetical protein
MGNVKPNHNARNPGNFTVFKIGAKLMCSPGQAVFMCIVLHVKNNLITVPLLPFQKAVSQLRRLIAGLSPRRPGFDPRSIHVAFVVEKVRIG